MKNAKKFGISDSQLIAVVVGAILGGGITTMPRTVAESAGRDGWISTGLAGIMVIFIALLVWLLCKRFPTKTLPEFSILILGKPLGIMVSVIYSLYALVMAGTALRLYTELVINWILPWTPMWVFLIALIIPAVYSARMGAMSLARFMELVLYLTIIATLLFLTPLREITLDNIRPVGAEGIAAIAGGVPDAAFSFLGFEVLLIFYPFVVERRRVLLIYLATIGLITVFYMINSLLIYAALGVENTILLVWPLINYLRVGTLPIFERIDTIVMFLWFAQVVGVVAVQYFAGTYSLATLTRHSHHDLWAVLVWPIVLFVGIAPNRLFQVVTVEELVGRYSFIFIVVLILLLLGVAVLRGLDES